MKPLIHKKRKCLIDEGHHLVPVSTTQIHQTQIQQMRRELTSALHNLRYIASHCETESIIESIRDEWKFIATVLDRLQFVIFLAVTIFGSLALLYQVKRISSFFGINKNLFCFCFRCRIYLILVRMIRKN